MEYIPRSTTFHRSLIEIQMIGGVEKKLAILNGTIATALVFGIGLVEWLPVAILLHFFFVWLTKKDPYILKVYMRFNKQSDSYDPWPHAQQKYNHRPTGFGRGMLC